MLSKADFQDPGGALLPFSGMLSPSACLLGKTVSHNPGAAAKATASVAARLGYRHVCVGITASLACGANAQTPISINLIDGATGGAVILWNAVSAANVNGCAWWEETGFGILGSPNTAMTLEFSAAGVAASLEAVTLHYYDIEDK